eukprot:2426316-Amphidinium_carterae.1
MRTQAPDGEATGGHFPWASNVLHGGTGDTGDVGPGGTGTTGDAVPREKVPQAEPRALQLRHQGNRRAGSGCYSRNDLVSLTKAIESCTRKK